MRNQSICFPPFVGHERAPLSLRRAKQGAAPESGVCGVCNGGRPATESEQDDARRPEGRECVFVCYVAAARDSLS